MVRPPNAAQQENQELGGGGADGGAPFWSTEEPMGTDLSLQ